MHDEVLSPEQKKLLPLLGLFSDRFFLIGGTAVALEVGHRRSIDFDLVTFSELKTNDLRNKIGKTWAIETVLIDETNEFTFVIQGVKITFLKYPFPFKAELNYQNIVKMPGLLTLGSLKAYALGRRAKWKDYVDLFFILEKYSLQGLTQEAESLFGREFNEKQFREQLAYFKDIDYSEKVDFMPGFAKKNKVIQKKLQEISLQI